MAKEKKEKKERTYSPKGIWRELKQVEWPGFKGLMKSSGLVILLLYYLDSISLFVNSLPAVF